MAGEITEVEAAEVGRMLRQISQLAGNLNSSYRLIIECCGGDDHVGYKVVQSGSVVHSERTLNVLGAVRALRGKAMDLANKQLPELEKDAINAVRRVSDMQEAMGQNGTQRAEAAERMRKAMGQ